ncbi:hypothetical protein C7974DRAFT_408117 [Boeremia exigua]|uniref:uncharacterized protein n=1 Tax=Boeremia exigua TaxID=749465 RepID=UPI001E8E421C|nr:uncharacterized protein C7974DRAFT_408117 [Boeremia exigua]KAH6644438.1 hypothetical protein C7974DRAFT_408117 [Boeremia exigua]
MLSHDVEFIAELTLPSGAHVIQKLTDHLVSNYSHHGFLLSTVTLIVFFIATRLSSDYLFPKIIYRNTFEWLTASQKRRFVNHHVLISAKILMISLALYPYLAVVTGLADFSTPFIKGATTTMGDITIIATSIFIGMYLHELMYISSDVALVSVLHHLGAVLVASIMVTRNVRWQVESNTTAYTVLIMTYGIFDILAGLWPRPVLITRTVWPEKHRMNMWLCYIAMVLTILGTVGETIVAMYFYGIHMSGWSRAVQFATPFCHVAFMIAQGFSSKIMWTLARKHKRQLEPLEAAEKNINRAGHESSPCIGTIVINKYRRNWRGIEFK